VCKGLVSNPLEDKRIGKSEKVLQKVQGNNTSEMEIEERSFAANAHANATAQEV